MGTEIERKFRVRGDGWRDAADAGTAYRQGYIPGTGTCSVRVRVAGAHAYLNIKSLTLGVTRSEYEYPIPVTDAEEMLAAFCARPVIRKVRYRVPHGRHVWEVDVFEAENAGLVVAELELEDADEPFDRPEWLGEEVSHDARFYNVNLVAHPYRDWT